MPAKEISLYEQIRTNAVETDSSNLFYDWFCSDAAIPRKAKSLMSKVKQIAFSSKFNINETYVFFKNNCPMSGPLYDDFRICDLESGNVLFTVAPKATFYNGECTVFGRENDFETPLYQGTVKGMIAWFNEDHPAITLPNEE